MVSLTRNKFIDGFVLFSAATKKDPALLHAKRVHLVGLLTSTVPQHALDAMQAAPKFALHVPLALVLVLVLSQLPFLMLPPSLQHLDGTTALLTPLLLARAPPPTPSSLSPSPPPVSSPSRLSTSLMAVALPPTTTLSPSLPTTKMSTPSSLV